ncbi:helix-turn-helix domain-containing protein [Paracraurococcus lichenis]|uniref:Helix-turn-helix domain-containing protein n=1 Tax=Paracraurococcus lichenis TaxID=3064888 RepID=A0ABT9EC73_9PROT|nr:helix-turn-helix domain-containing protein [Paracraurococcus sp. LOR1-02]MDO9713815.1 helix-turn-helix domain-containing protein [Paracraurococcus sp. LOR1-02]
MFQVRTAMLKPMVHRSSLTEVGELLTPADHGACKAVPLRSYPFSLQTSVLELSGLSLQTGRSTPLAVLGTLPADTAWILLPLHGCRTVRLGGRAAGTHAVAVFGAAAEYEMANSQDSSWALIALRAADVGSVLTLPRRSTVLRPGGVAWLHTDAAAWTFAATLMQDATEVMEKDPDVFQVEEACRSLRAAVLEACQDLLAGPAGGRKPSTLPAAPASLRRIVRLADDYLAAYPSRATDTAQLASAVGVSEARLRLAFQTILGISATKYLVARRLVLVRMALRSPERPWVSVEEAAQAHGFWNRRSFERAYRLMFREALLRR